MKFLPIESIVYKAQLTEEEITRRLEDSIETERVFRSGLESAQPYKGQIIGNRFEISKIIGYKNSFLPVIKGKIEGDYNRTTITVKMRPRMAVLVFLFIWCSGVGIACIVSLIQVFNGSGFNPVIFIPFGMLAFAYLLTMGAFKFESSKSKQDLAAIFEAEIIEAWDSKKGLL